jgi:hypothetical protein
VNMDVMMGAGWEWIVLGRRGGGERRGEDRL